MTATYTFDVFSSLDAYAAASVGCVRAAQDAKRAL